MTEPIVVIGDSLLDVDLITHASRLAPETSGPVLEQRARHERPGGAALAALLASRGSRPVVLITSVADDEAGHRLQQLLADRVHVIAVARAPATVVKTRLLASDRLVARLDTASPSQPERNQPLPAAVRDAVDQAAVVLVADYGGGVTSISALRELLAARAPRLPIVWDPHPRGAGPIPGVQVVTPNSREAATASGFAGDGVQADARRAELLVSQWHARAVVITRGADGALLSFGPDTAPVAVAAPVAFAADRAADTCGAGDCFAAALAMQLGEGQLLSSAVQAAVQAASLFVARGAASGMHRPVVSGDQSPDAPEDSARLVQQQLQVARANGSTVVATGGCFDLLHAGHIATLEAARALGDLLVVCLNSDRSVRALKGDQRPLQPAQDRVKVLASLRCVDAVVVFDEDTPTAVLREVRPDIWVKGGDYDGSQLPETTVLQEWGGQVVIVPYLMGRSTSQLVTLARQ